MKGSRLVALGVVLASAPWLLTGGCASGSADLDSDGNGTAGTSPADGGGGPVVVMPGTSGTAGTSGLNLNPLCGQAPAQCLPDDSGASCSGYEPPVLPTQGGAGGEGGVGGAGGVGQGGNPNEPVAGEGGQSQGGAAQAGQSTGGAADGGAGGEGGVEPPASFGCQVVRVGNQLERQCQLAGDGVVNAPCFSAADCQAGLACVAEGEAGRCLRYCCAGDGACSQGSYCADRPLRKLRSDTSNAEPPRVPVCVPADGCSLEDEYPCPDDAECRCQGTTACMVVRADGTTTCREPGIGEQGDPCPCAWNHVCSSVTQKCVKICNIDPAKDDCAPQKCQASSELPQNFGVCVGPLK